MNTISAKSINARDFSTPPREWIYGTSITCSSGEDATVGCWVVAHSPTDTQNSIFGKVVEILVSELEVTDTKCIVAIEQYHLGENLHSVFDMPILSRRFGEKEILALNNEVS